MKARGSGQIVFVSSDGIRVGTLGREKFAADKASLKEFGRNLAAESRRSSNVAAPGGTIPGEQAAQLPDRPLLHPGGRRQHRRVSHFTRQREHRRDGDPGLRWHVGGMRRLRHNACRAVERAGLVPPIEAPP
ncbi:hypothetical protein [Nonomuraea sp. NPDC050643]|uniref:hypothetical protein n=1 Tax=Nonomuraea sp. NPDC050643 TaxID=3155660 RepID=UPI0033DFC49F